MDNVTPILDQDETLKKMQEKVYHLFAEYGRARYSADCAVLEANEIEVKLRNANTDAFKFSQKLMKERAEKLTVEEKVNEQGI